MLALAVALVSMTEVAATRNPIVSSAAALYEEICLKAFPDDAAVDALMTAKGATKLTPDQVKITLVDDPGRGWTLKVAGSDILVILELPPYHACSVRWPETDFPADLTPYRAVADRFVAGRPGFTAAEPFDDDIGNIHVHATGLQRTDPTGATESLFIFDQHVTDPARRAKGETGVMMRFVHQIHEAG